jgi:isopentenyldiphosphate isomerase
LGHKERRKLGAGDQKKLQEKWNAAKQANPSLLRETAYRSRPLKNVLGRSWATCLYHLADPSTLRGKMKAGKVLSMAPSTSFPPVSGGDLLDVLSDNCLRTGEVLPRAKIHQQGKLHKAVHLYLFNNEGAILLQKRGPSVCHYPNMWSISLTGHVETGETSTMALKRELEEELGFGEGAFEASFLFSYRRDETLSPTYIDRQMHDVFLGVCSTDKLVAKPDGEEVVALNFIPFEIFLRLTREKSSDLVPVYKEVAHDVLFFARQCPLLHKSLP